MVFPTHLYTGHDLIAGSRSSRRVMVANSCEKTPGCLGYIGDNTTQVYRDFNKPYKDPYKPTSILESNKVCFS